MRRRLVPVVLRDLFHTAWFSPRTAVIYNIHGRTCWTCWTGFRVRRHVTRLYRQQNWPSNDVSRRSRTLYRCHSSLDVSKSSTSQYRQDRSDLDRWGARSKLECLPDHVLPLTMGVTSSTSPVSHVYSAFSSEYTGISCAAHQHCLHQVLLLRCCMPSSRVILTRLLATALTYTLLAGAPKTLTEKLQRSMNAAQKFGRGLTHLWRDVLRWLDVTDRITFRLCVHVFKCLRRMAPSYLSELYRPVAEFEGRRHAVSSTDVPRYCLATFGRRPQVSSATQDGKRGTGFRTIGFRDLSFQTTVENVFVARY